MELCREKWGNDMFSVECFQTIGLMQVFGWEMEWGSRCNYEERRFMREEILISVQRQNYLK